MARKMIAKSLPVPLAERALLLGKTMCAIDRYFVHWEDTNLKSIDEIYQKYSGKVLGANDRQSMLLAMSELIAELGNGHSSYVDEALKRKTIPFKAFYHDVAKRWVVSDSALKGINVGDVIMAINKVPVERLYAKVRGRISGSNDRMRRNRLFSNPRISLPESFELGLGGGSKIRVRQRNAAPAAPPKSAVSYKSLGDGIGYIKIEDFSRAPGKRSEEEAMGAVRKLWNSNAIIIDIRGNSGGSTPIRLMQLLMDRDWNCERFATIKQKPIYRAISEAYKGNELNSHEYAYFQATKCKCNKRHYPGRLFIIVDHNTISAAEDFVMPFKVYKRATIIGSTTAGSTGDGYVLRVGTMRVKIGAVRCWLPNGGEFEGVGIKPDVVSYPTIRDMQTGNDRVLGKAIAIAKGVLPSNSKKYQNAAEKP